MKKILIISFDLIRPGESSTSLSIGSLLAALKQSEYYDNKFLVEHKSVNLLNENTRQQDLTNLRNSSFGQYDCIALSAYIWGEHHLREFLFFLRTEYQYKGVIALGGYQVSYANDECLTKDYPEADTFIKGYAEQSFVKLVHEIVHGNIPPKIMHSTINNSFLPSPYLTNEIQIHQNQHMVRLESKRGCPYKCTFCAHKDNIENKLQRLQKEKVMLEIELMAKRNVEKINFLDPVFNMDSDYIDILSHFVTIGFKGQVALQSRPERIAGEKGTAFLQQLQKIDAFLEFGIQTLDEKVNKIIRRQNNYSQIYEAIGAVKDANIDFEISLIYGLPGQTLSSFQSDIDKLQSLGVENITAWPLMLLKGTELYTQKSKFNFRETSLGVFNIPHVVESNTYSESDWQKMHDIAVALNPNSRVY